MLERHILDFYFEKFSESLAIGKHFMGSIGVNVYFNYTVRFKGNHAVADVFEILCYYAYIKNQNIVDIVSYSQE